MLAVIIKYVIYIESVRFQDTYYVRAKSINNSQSGLITRTNHSRGNAPTANHSAGKYHLDFCHQFQIQ